MSDFGSAFWHWYVAILTIISIAACAVLLYTQTTKRPPKGEKASLHGNVWDEDLTEYNHPLPRWWMWLFYITIVFSLVYLFLYPGLGAFGGKFAWSSVNAYAAEKEAAAKQYGPLFEKFASVDLAVLAKDPQANAMGQRLFLNECAPCHGSDGGGGPGFPNLRDGDWLYGGDPQTIETSIANGRNGVMPPLGASLGEGAVTELTHYVRALAGLKHDAQRAEAGKAKFAVCAACHGADGRGNQQIGAPNLTDNIWLYGSNEETIAQTIRAGRNNLMPAQKDRLGDAKVHLLAAYVLSLQGADRRASAPGGGGAAASP
jgi:cytochrome c oxidase cbb3-type subunit III